MHKCGSTCSLSDNRYSVIFQFITVSLVSELKRISPMTWFSEIPGSSPGFLWKFVFEIKISMGFWRWIFLRTFLLPCSLRYILIGIIKLRLMGIPASKGTTSAISWGRSTEKFVVALGNMISLPEFFLRIWKLKYHIPFNGNRPLKYEK